MMIVCNLKKIWEFVVHTWGTLPINHSGINIHTIVEIQNNVTRIVILQLIVLTIVVSHTTVLKLMIFSTLIAKTFYEINGITSLTLHSIRLNNKTRVLCNRTSRKVYYNWNITINTVIKSWSSNKTQCITTFTFYLNVAKCMISLKVNLLLFNVNILGLTSNSLDNNEVCTVRGKVIVRIERSDKQCHSRIQNANIESTVSL